MKITVILPSLNPDEKMVNTVIGLKEHGFNDIVVVNDGSDDKQHEDQGDQGADVFFDPADAAGLVHGTALRD